MQRDLVIRAMAGDRDAFSELVRIKLAQLFATARLILRDSDLAQDAVQESLVAAWRDLAGLRDPERFDAWLRSLLVRACYSEAGRHRRRRHVESLVPPLTGSVPDPSAAAADRDEVGRAFLRLSPEQRALIVLHYYEGLPLSETAIALGLPLGTVKTRLYRTTAQMRASLDADGRLALHRMEAT